jgi:hypothetical protein
MIDLYTFGFRIIIQVQSEKLPDEALKLLKPPEPELTSGDFLSLIPSRLTILFPPLLILL